MSLARIARYYAVAALFGWLAGWVAAWWKWSKPQPWPEPLHLLDREMDDHLTGTIAGGRR